MKEIIRISTAIIIAYFVIRSIDIIYAEKKLLKIKRELEDILKFINKGE